MAALDIIDLLSWPGSDKRPNEDRVGSAADVAFVIDGATGLGENFVPGGHGSDAAWLAEFAAVRFVDLLAMPRPIGEVVRTINTLAGQIVAHAAGTRQIEAWRLPIAGFTLARLEADALCLYGLGDCVAVIAHRDGTTERFCPMGHNAREIDEARQAIARGGRLRDGDPLPADDTLLATERALRATFNTPSGPLWTLGIVPVAADNLVETRIAAATIDHVLLATDGFSALVDKYGACTDAELVRLAVEGGLEPLATRLREIERIEHSHGHVFAGMKVSDDASAMLARIAG